MKIERFEDIEDGQIGRELTRRIYAATSRGGFAKAYGLKDQIQRASGSAMHNVAEGFDGGGNAEFAKFLRYAQRSCTEGQSELYVALDQSYLTQQEFSELYELAQHARAKIGGFINSSCEPNRASTDTTKHQAQRTKHVLYFPPSAFRFLLFL